MEPLTHKHVIIQARVAKPPRDVAYIEQWMRELIDDIGMKIARGPIAFYSEMEGNVGLTCIAVIETSHVTFHTFEDEDPTLLEFDIYSCQDLDVQQVLAFIDEFEPMEISFMFLDRHHNLTVKETGNRKIVR
jgi:S-adenosylmethionine/arginine decarboxylase-like enzyme